MKVAVIGSWGLTVSNLGDYLPDDVTEIISGGAAGIDTCARHYALSHGIKLTEFLPDYRRFGRAAPLKRNLDIIQICRPCFGILGWFFPPRKRRIEDGTCP